VVTLLIFIWSVTGSCPSQDMDYPDWDLLWLSSVHQGKYQDSTLNLAMTDFFHILRNSLFTVIRS
jgi:hypothetical protein